jgi:carbon storage regulator
MPPGMLTSAVRTLMDIKGAGCLVDDQASREAHPPMLVLTRKSNQSIMIGDDIEVSVLAIMGEKVRIGIQAPRDIPVFRKEVYLEIQQERLGSGKGAREEVDAALRGLGEGS